MSDSAPSLPASIREALDRYAVTVARCAREARHRTIPAMVELNDEKSAARDALEAHLLALVADAERLDAMEKGGWCVTPDTGSRWTVWVNSPSGGGDYDEVELTRHHRPATLRAAIDAARTPPEDTTPHA